MPFSPGAAAMPERGARIPILSGLFCAMAGAKMPDIDSAPAAATDFKSLRRDKAMVTLPVGPASGRLVIIACMIYQTHVSNKHAAAARAQNPSARPPRFRE